MFITGHLIIGLLIGKLTHNYTVAVLTSLLVDIDHLIPYLRHGIMLKPTLIWQAVISAHDHQGYQRNLLHSFITLTLIGSLLVLLHFNWGIIIIITWASHLFVDMIDNSDFYPFYPLTYNFKGPIVYLSTTEYIITAILLVAFFLL
ncbi:hypothetical protein GF342_05835 [Candidatus Woesearchaeota archaeon]|nr:hypothetical protein [Candidatus Woesearchaeota archaeon]